MNTTNSEKSVKELFVGKCWEYLNDNFHKFTEANKIKIALELCKKDLPQEITGIPGVKVNVYPGKTIVYRDLDESSNRTAEDRSLHEPTSSEGSRIEGTI